MPIPPSNHYIVAGGTIETVPTSSAGAGTVEVPAANLKMVLGTGTAFTVYDNGGYIWFPSVPALRLISGVDPDGQYLTLDTPLAALLAAGATYHIAYKTFKEVSLLDTAANSGRVMFPDGPFVLLPDPPAKSEFCEIGFPVIVVDGGANGVFVDATS